MNVGGWPKSSLHRILKRQRQNECKATCGSNGRSSPRVCCRVHKGYCCKAVLAVWSP